MPNCDRSAFKGTCGTDVFSTRTLLQRFSPSVEQIRRYKMGDHISLLNFVFICLSSNRFRFLLSVYVCVVNYFEFIELNGTACHFLNFKVACALKFRSFNYLSPGRSKLEA